MKRQTMKIVLLLILLVAISSGYVALKNHNKATEDETQEDTSIQVLSVTSADVSKLSYEYQGNTLDFEYTDNTWYYTKDKELPLDTTYIDTILSEVTDLTAERELENTLDNIAEYGLDKPSFTLKITDKDGKLSTIYIGDQNAKSENYYCYVEGDTNVYMISSALAASLSYDINSLVKIDTVPTIASTDIYDFIIDDRHFVYLDEGSEKYDYTEGTRWFEEKADGSYVPVDSTYMTTLLSDVTGMTYTSCAAYNADENDLETYGLNKAVKITAQYMETVTDEAESEDTTEESSTEAQKIAKTFTIYIGEKDSDGNYYVKTDDSNAVNVVTGTQLADCMEIDESELAYKDFANISKDKIKKLTVTADGKDYELVKDGELTEDSYDSAFSALLALSAEKTITDTSKVSTDVYAKISYVLENSTVDIEFTSYNGSYYAVSVNGNTNLLVVKRDVEDFIAAID